MQHGADCCLQQQRSLFAPRRFCRNTACLPEGAQHACCHPGACHMAAAISYCRSSSSQPAMQPGPAARPRAPLHQGVATCLVARRCHPWWGLLGGHAAARSCRSRCCGPFAASQGQGHHQEDDFETGEHAAAKFDSDCFGPVASGAACQSHVVLASHLLCASAVALLKVC